MKKKMPTWEKVSIGVAILALIILLIIWYNNNKKTGAAAQAKSKTLASNIATQTGTTVTTPPADVPDNSYLVTAPLTSVSNPVCLYTVDGNFDQAYCKTNPNEFVGIVTATQTDDGSTSFYKIVNSNSEYYYVAKIQVVKQ